MASLKKDMNLKLQTTREAEIEENSFSSGDQVQLVESWEKLSLIKDDDGHYYYVPKEDVEP